jgi:muconolactone delta-isomerase
MRFLVESTFKQAPTPELLALIPAETRHGLMLDARGVRELLLVASDNTRAWQVFRAESPAALQAIVDGFPLARYLAATVTPLADPPAQARD